MSGRTRLYFRGNWRTKRTKAASEGTGFFHKKRAPKGSLLTVCGSKVGPFTAHSRDHLATITDVTVRFGSGFGSVFSPVLLHACTAGIVHLTVLDDVENAVDHHFSDL